MQWTELKPDAHVEEAPSLFAVLDCVSAIRCHANLVRGAHLYVLRDCAERIMRHVASDSKEVGGLLLGRVWMYKGAGNGAAIPLVFILDAVASTANHHTSVSLEMGTDVWNSANARASGPVLVVGWYHSHPNLGAFFSATDRNTQQAFFTNPYSVGWVIDPVRNEEKVFLGKHSEEYRRQLVRLRREPDWLPNAAAE